MAMRTASTAPAAGFGPSRQIRTESANTMAETFPRLRSYRTGKLIAAMPKVMRLTHDRTGMIAHPTASASNRIQSQMMAAPPAGKMVNGTSAIAICGG